VYASFVVDLVRVKAPASAKSITHIHHRSSVLTNSSNSIISFILYHSIDSAL
jgi:hypothetical protein